MMLPENFLKSRVFWLKLLFVITAIVLVYNTIDFLVSLILAVALAFIINPLVQLLSLITIGPNKLPLPRVAVILLSFVFVLAGIFLAAIFIAVPLATEINNLSGNMPMIMTSIREWVFKMQGYLPDDINSIINQTLNSLEAFVVTLVSNMAKALVGFLSNAFQLVVVPFLSFYLLKDWRSIRSNLIKVLPHGYQQSIESYFDDVAFMLSSYVRGIFKMCCITGTVISVMTYAMDIHYSLVLGLLAGIGEALPILGPIFAVLPAVILTIVYTPDMLIKVLIFYIFYYVVDSNVFIPKVMGEAINLHPVVILFSLLIGGKLFGVMGMIFAVPTTAFFKISFEHIFIKSR